MQTRSVSRLNAASKIFVLLALAALIAFGVYMAGHAGVKPH